MANSDISVIIISFNTCKITCDCIRSIQVTAPDAKICVVDNASSDDTRKVIEREFPDVKFIQNSDNFGYSKAVNIGVKNCSDGNYVIISNADVIYHKDCINNLISFLRNNPSAAPVAPIQLFPNGKRQQSSGLLPGIKSAILNFLLITPIYARLSKKYSLRGDYLDGAVLAIRNKDFDRIGGFDEDFFFYSEDADFSKKARKNGYSPQIANSAFVTHLRGGSTNIGGINSNALEMFVSAKIKLAGKYCSKSIVRFYILSERFNSEIMSIIFNFSTKIVHSDSLIYKKQYYLLLAKIWKNHIKQ